MTRQARDHNVDERDVEVHAPKRAAARLTAVVVSVKRSHQEMRPTRTAKTLLKLNQTDCMSCAWPDSAHRHTAEFCENGAKAVVEEATKERVGREFLKQYSVKDLAGYRLQAGRAGAAHSSVPSRACPESHS